jgi:hypothetical protein
MTGFSHLTGELTGKRLQLLKDALPRLRRVAALVTEKHRAIEGEAARLGLQIQFFIESPTADLRATYQDEADQKEHHADRDERPAQVRDRVQEGTRCVGKVRHQEVREGKPF